MHIGLVGPLPPPFGGMANQTRQLAELLRSEGLTVSACPNQCSLSPTVGFRPARHTRHLSSCSLPVGTLESQWTLQPSACHGQLRLVVAFIRGASHLDCQTAQYPGCRQLSGR
jgi:hypothetical protein